MDGRRPGEEQKDGRMDGCTDGWVTGGWVCGPGWIDGWWPGKMGASCNPSFYLFLTWPPSIFILPGHHPSSTFSLHGCHLSVCSLTWPIDPLICCPSICPPMYFESLMNSQRDGRPWKVNLDDRWMDGWQLPGHHPPIHPSIHPSICPSSKHEEHMKTIYIAI